MNIEINKPYANNYGEELEYISTYIKGKSGKGVKDYRILVRGVKSGTERLLFLDPRENFFGRKVMYLIGECGFKYITPDLLKNKNYNYYNLGYDPSTVDEFFSEWISKDPFVHVGNYQHTFRSMIKDYTWAYKFNNKLY